jgi:hypothetical protein
MNEVHETCCNCGIGFCLPTPLYEARKKDHGTFYCPNGHGQHYIGKTDDEKKIDRLESMLEDVRGWHQEAIAGREELVGVLHECPVPDCTFRSRKQIPRDPVAMGRGIERVRADIFEHLVSVHSSRVSEARGLLPAAT